MNDTKLPHIKGSAIINLSVGGEMISRIQAALLYLTDGMTDAESTELQNKITSNSQLSPKDAAIVTLSTIMLAISKEAERTGQIQMQSVEETFTPRD